MIYFYKSFRWDHIFFKGGWIRLLLWMDGHAACHLWLAAWPDISGKAVPQKQRVFCCFCMCVYIYSLCLSVRTSIHVLAQARSIADIRGRCVSYAVGIKPGCDAVPQWWNSAHGVTHLPSFYVNSPLLVVVLLVHKTADRRKWTHHLLEHDFWLSKMPLFHRWQLFAYVSGDDWQQFSHLLCAIRIN